MFHKLRYWVPWRWVSKDIDGNQMCSDTWRTCYHCVKRLLWKIGSDEWFEPSEFIRNKQIVFKFLNESPNNNDDSARYKCFLEQNLYWIIQGSIFFYWKKFYMYSKKKKNTTMCLICKKVIMRIYLNCIFIAIREYIFGVQR